MKRLLGAIVLSAVIMLSACNSDDNKMNNMNNMNEEMNTDMKSGDMKEKDMMKDEKKDDMMTEKKMP